MVKATYVSVIRIFSAICRFRLVHILIDFFSSTTRTFMSQSSILVLFLTSENFLFFFLSWALQLHVPSEGACLELTSFKFSFFLSFFLSFFFSFFLSFF